MKHFLIWMLGMAVVGSSWAQSAMHEDAYGVLGYQFTKENLQPAEIAAFSDRARQKLIDVSSYLEVIAEDQYDTAMRKEAGRIAVAMFLDQKERFWFVSSDCAGHALREIGGYVAELAEKADGKSLRHQVDSVWVAEPAVLEGEGRYRGTLGFSAVSTAAREDEAVCVHRIAGKINFWVVREKKAFGNKKKKVWAVKLGSVLEG
ncbi:MAG: hypothetical protein AAGN35_18855 [Bacteroidota bacterium]